MTSGPLSPLLMVVVSLAVLAWPTFEDELTLSGTGALCQQLQWYCDPKCYETIDDTCQSPSRDEPVSCLDAVIDYNYTIARGFAHVDLQRFEVMRRFPRCWKSLRPLLCAVIYRPCRHLSFTNRTGGVGSFRASQRFRRELCTHAWRDCAFLHDLGLWPAFVDCDNRVHMHADAQRGRDLFTDRCPRRFVESPAIFPVEHTDECLSPLIAVDALTLQRVDPLIDHCALPCQTTQVSGNYDVVAYRGVQFTLALVLCLLSLLIFLWLAFISECFLHDDEVFVISQALLAIAGYCAGLLPTGMGDGVCREDGTRLPDIAQRKLWCTGQSWLLHATLLSGSLWLVLLVLLHRPRLRLLTGDLACIVTIRVSLVFCVNFLAAFLACLATMATSTDVNSVTGVCQLGGRHFEQALLVYIPLSVVAIVAFCGLARLLVLQVRGHNATRMATTVSDVAIMSSGDASAENAAMIAVDSSSSTKTQEELSQSRASHLSLHLLTPLVLTLLFSLVICMYLHRDLTRTFARERDDLMQAVRCTLQSALANRTRPVVSQTNATSMEWHDEQFDTARLSPSCPMPARLDGEMLKLLLVFVLLPCLPYTILIVFVLAGLCGWSGVDVTVVRANLNPFERVKSREEMKREIEMQLRASDGDENVDVFPAGQKVRFSSSERLHDAGLHVQAPSPIPSTSHSEPPLHSRATKSGVRKIDLLQRSIERRRRNGPLNASWHTTTAHLQVPRIEEQSRAHGDDASSVQSSLNMTVASGDNTGDPMLRAHILHAYEMGVREGQWMERCRRHANTINDMNGLLQGFESELRRLTGMPPGEQGIVPGGAIHTAGSQHGQTFALTAAGVPIEWAVSGGGQADGRAVPAVHINIQAPSAATASSSQPHVKTATKKDAGKSGKSTRKPTHSPIASSSEEATWDSDESDPDEKAFIESQRRLASDPDAERYVKEMLARSGEKRAQRMAAAGLTEADVPGTSGVSLRRPPDPSPQGGGQASAAIPPIAIARGNPQMPPGGLVFVRPATGMVQPGETQQVVFVQPPMPANLGGGGPPPPPQPPQGGPEDPPAPSSSG